MPENMAPGVVVLDYDGDGLDDLYISAGRALRRRRGSRRRQPPLPADRGRRLRGRHRSGPRRRLGLRHGRQRRRHRRRRRSRSLHHQLRSGRSARESRRRDLSRRDGGRRAGKRAVERRQHVLRRRRGRRSRSLRLGLRRLRDGQPSLVRQPRAQPALLLPPGRLRGAARPLLPQRRHRPFHGCRGGLRHRHRRAGERARRGLRRCDGRRTSRLPRRQRLHLQLPLPRRRRGLVLGGGAPRGARRQRRGAARGEHGHRDRRPRWRWRGGGALHPSRPGDQHALPSRPGRLDGRDRGGRPGARRACRGSASATRSSTTTPTAISISSWPTGTSSTTSRQFDAARAYRQPLQLFANDGGGRFSETSAELGFAEPLVGRGVATGDLDRDLDVDVVLAQNGDRVLYLENRGPAAPALSVRLAGTASNTAGFGARLTLRVGGRSSVRWMRANEGYFSQGPAEVFFGLGGEPQGGHARDRVALWSAPAPRLDSVGPSPASARAARLTSHKKRPPLPGALEMRCQAAETLEADLGAELILPRRRDEVVAEAELGVAAAAGRRVELAAADVEGVLVEDVEALGENLDVQRSGAEALGDAQVDLVDRVVAEGVAADDLPLMTAREPGPNDGAERVAGGVELALDRRPRRAVAVLEDA